MNLCIPLSFLLYNTFSEIDRRLGEGALRRMAFFPAAPALTMAAPEDENVGRTVG